MRSLAVVIVNYRTAELVKACVASVDEQLAAGPLEYKIFIVENDSADGSLDLLESAYRGRADVEVVSAGRNGGYAAGNNLVLAPLVEAGEYDFAWLLNPDTVALSGISERVVEIMMRPRTAALGARLQYPDETPQCSAFRFPGAFSEFLQAASLSPLNRWFAKWRVVQPVPDAMTRTDWLAGASVLFKLAALRDVGLFDEAFFLYFEEVDLFERLAEAGWESWYFPEMRVIHHVGAASGISNDRRAVEEMPEYWYASRSHYFLKQRGPLGALWVDVCWAAGRLVSVLARQILRRTDTAAVKCARIYAHNPLARSLRTSRWAQDG